MTTDQTCEKPKIDDRGVQPPEQAEDIWHNNRTDEVRRSWSDDMSCRTLLQVKVRQRKAESVPTVLQWHRAQGVPKSSTRSRRW